MSGLLFSGDIFINRLTDEGAETGWQGPLNTTQLTLNSPSTRVNRTSRKKASYGQALDTVNIAQVTEISIVLDDQPSEVLAMALLGDTSVVNTGSGTVADEAVTLPADGKWAKLAQQNLASGGLGAKLASDDSVIDVVNIEVNFALGLVRAKPGGTLVAGAAIKFSYQHNAITGTVIKGGIKPQIRAKIRGDLKNLATGALASLNVFEASLAPTNPVDLMSAEFVSTTLSGVCKLVEGQDAPFEIMN